MKSKRFLLKLSGNCSCKIALVKKFKFLVYQNKDFDFVVFHFENQVQEFILTCSFEVRVEYFKVSYSGKYLFVKFEDMRVVVWNLIKRVKVSCINELEKSDFLLRSDRPEAIFFHHNINLYDYKTGMDLETIHWSKYRIDFFVLHRGKNNFFQWPNSNNFQHKVKANSPLNPKHKPHLLFKRPQIFTLKSKLSPRY